jgi:hypothetical protein
MLEDANISSNGNHKVTFITAVYVTPPAKLDGQTNKRKCSKVYQLDATSAKIKHVALGTCGSYFIKAKATRSSPQLQFHNCQL